MKPGRNPLPEQFRFYQLVKITGWTQAEIDATPADTCDWILAIHRVVSEAEARQREAERR